MDSEPEPPTIDYAGRTPNAPRQIDEVQRSLGEGCAAMAILAIVLPAVALLALGLLIGCALLIFSPR